MSKKEVETRMCNGSGHCHMRPDISIHIENLHIGDDHYKSRTYMCGDSNKDEFVEVDLKPLAQRVAEQTGVNAETVYKVLYAEHDIFEEMGICESVKADREQEEKHE